MVFSDGLSVAGLAELAGRAMVVQEQRGQDGRSRHVLQLTKESFCCSGVGVEANPRRLAVLAVPNDADARCFALKPREQQSVEVEELPMRGSFLSCPPARNSSGM